jgi:hypothetical protein
MIRHRIWSAIDLDQHESCGVILLLNHIKARDTRFLNARAGIIKGRLPEDCNRFRFDPHVNVDDEHFEFPPLPILLPCCPIGFREGNRPTIDPVSIISRIFLDFSIIFIDIAIIFELT